MGRKRKEERKYYIGIDNGISGSIGMIGPNGFTNFILPKEYVKMEQDYTKTKKNVSRIDHPKLLKILSSIPYDVAVYVMLERPMVNPGKMQASYSALRALEATIIACESFGMSITFVASTDWSKTLLPKGVKGPALKKASLDIGSRLFPQHKDLFIKQKDADGMLIAEYCRRTFK